MHGLAWEEVPLELIEDGIDCMGLASRQGWIGMARTELVDATNDRELHFAENRVLQHRREDILDGVFALRLMCVSVNANSPGVM